MTAVETEAQDGSVWNHNVRLPLTLPANIMLPGWQVQVVTDKGEITNVIHGVVPDA